MIMGKTPEVANRIVAKKNNKKQNNKKGRARNKKKNYYDEDEESNFEEEVGYQSDSGSVTNKEKPQSYLKSLLLKKGEE